MWTRFLCALLVTGCAMAQSESAPPPPAGSVSSGTVSRPAASAAASTTQPAPAQAATSQPVTSQNKSQTAPASTMLVIPSGTKVPLALKQAISTKGAKEGDPVYCETTFPFVVNDRIV